VRERREEDRFLVSRWRCPEPSAPGKIIVGQAARIGLVKETVMGHMVRIRSREHYLAALHVLNNVEGTWRARGPASEPVLLLTDAQYRALVEAGVVPFNDTEVQTSAKKKRTKS
jgi:hypothetical protein